MATKQEIKLELSFWRESRDKLQEAYLALISGRVKSYMIDDRSLSNYDLDKIRNELAYAKSMIDELEGELNGLRARRAFGVIPLDL